MYTDIPEIRVLGNRYVVPVYKCTVDTVNLRRNTRTNKVTSRLVVVDGGGCYGVSVFRLRREKNSTWGTIIILTSRLRVLPLSTVKELFWVLRRSLLPKVHFIELRFFSPILSTGLRVYFSFRPFVRFTIKRCSHLK